MMAEEGTDCVQMLKIMAQNRDDMDEMRAYMDQISEESRFWETTVVNDYDSLRFGAGKSLLTNFSDSMKNVLGVQRCRKKFVSVVKKRRTHDGAGGEKAADDMRWWKVKQRENERKRLDKHPPADSIPSCPKTPDYRTLLAEQSVLHQQLDQSDLAYRQLLFMYEGIQGMINKRFHDICTLSPTPSILPPLKVPGTPSSPGEHLAPGLTKAIDDPALSSSNSHSASFEETPGGGTRRLRKPPKAKSHTRRDPEPDKQNQSVLPSLKPMRVVGSPWQ
ncbi:hypothetical protein DIPPA_35225 [Diplonema papillatum]|nr:hypothetical protein DIPPA_35225 [Diplonema papillatum]